MTEPNTPSPELPGFLDSIFERPIAASVQPANPAPEEAERNRLFTIESLQQLADSHTVQISEPLNLSTIRQLSGSIIQIPEATDSDALPDLIAPTVVFAEPNLRFAVNTVSDDLLIRSVTGSVTGSFPKDSILTYAGDFRVFKFQEQKTLMLKMRDGTTEGYVAAPFLKIANPQEPTTPVADAPTLADPEAPQPASAAPAAAVSPPVLPLVAAAIPETLNPSLNRIRATSMDRVSGVGDSIGVGMHENGFSRISALGSRPTSGHLTEVQRLISSREINSENTDSFILYGAGNNFPSSEFSQANVDQAISDFTEMVEILLTAGIQPVVCTMFESMHGGRRRNTTQTDIDNHPRIRAIRMFNNAMRSLAIEKSIPLIDMHTLTPQNPQYIIHPGDDFYRQMVNVIESSLSTHP
jgi:hypothetical protein